MSIFAETKLFYRFFARKKRKVRAAKGAVPGEKPGGFFERKIYRKCHRNKPPSGKGEKGV